MEVDLKELILRALDLAQRRGAQYTDVRVVNNRRKHLGKGWYC
jgi:hypothetical protein